MLRDITCLDNNLGRYQSMVHDEENDHESLSEDMSKICDSSDANPLKVKRLFSELCREKVQFTKNYAEIETSNRQKQQQVRSLLEALSMMNQRNELDQIQVSNLTKNLLEGSCLHVVSENEMNDEYAVKQRDHGTRMATAVHNYRSLLY